MARLFVALYPPLEVASALLDALATLDLQPHRLTPLEQVHMTVLFVGETPERELPNAIESVERAAAGVRAFELTPRRLIALPDRGPARLVAADAEAPGALVELRRRLVARLVAPRQRAGPLLPHFTLCRFRAPTRLELAPVELPARPFGVDAISLQQSILRPEGAEHRQVARIALATR